MGPNTLPVVGLGGGHSHHVLKVSESFAYVIFSQVLVILDSQSHRVLNRSSKVNNGGRNVAHLIGRRAISSGFGTFVLRLA